MQLEQYTRGVGVPTLNRNLVHEVEIPLPPLAEQKRIAAILDQAARLTRLRAEALAKLDTLGQAIFHEMFGEEQANAKLKSLKELTSKIGSGATPRGGNAAYKLSGVPLIRSMNVRDGFFDPKGLAFLDGSQAAALDNVVVEANDVLLNITGASVARVARAPENMEGARVNQHVAIIRPTAELLPEYLEAYLLMPKTKTSLLKIAEAGATRQAITKAQIEALKIPCIPLQEQLTFLAAKNAASTSLAASNTQYASLKTLFASLQHRAFRGEL